jgi:hypothetical protein
MSKQFCLRLVMIAFVCITGFSMPDRALAVICPPHQQPCHTSCISERDLCILEPVPGGVTSLRPNGTAFSTFFSYLNSGVWQWAFGIGVAIAVLNGTIGGFQIVLSNGDSGKVDAGKNRFVSSAIGLLMLLLSGVILAFLNPMGFINV